jgi:hypothetical protein
VLQESHHTTPATWGMEEGDSAVADNSDTADTYAGKNALCP